MDKIYKGVIVYLVFLSNHLFAADHSESKALRIIKYKIPGIIASPDHIQLIAIRSNELIKEIINKLNKITLLQGYRVTSLILKKGKNQILLDPDDTVKDSGLWGFDYNHDELQCWGAYAYSGSNSISLKKLA